MPLYVGQNISFEVSFMEVITFTPLRSSVKYNPATKSLESNDINESQFSIFFVNCARFKSNKSF